MSRDRGVSRSSLKAKHEQRVLIELNYFTTKLNDELEKDPIVAHLMPIELGGEDLCEKVRDGTLLSSLLVRMPDCENAIDMDKIHKPAKKENGMYERLNMFKSSANNDKLLKAAEKSGVNVRGIGVLDLMDALKQKKALKNLLQSIYDLDPENRRVRIAVTTDVRTDAQTVSINIDPDMEITEDDSDEAIPHLRAYFNSLLGPEQENLRLSEEKGFAKQLRDCQLYSFVMYRINPYVCPDGSFDMKKPLGRADFVLQYAKALGMQVSLENYSIAFGDNTKHVPFCIELRRVGESKRLEKQIMAKARALVRIASLIKANFRIVEQTVDAQDVLSFKEKEQLEEAQRGDKDEVQPPPKAPRVEPPQLYALLPAKLSAILYEKGYDGSQVPADLLPKRVLDEMLDDTDDALVDIEAVSLLEEFRALKPPGPPGSEAEERPEITLMLPEGSLEMLADVDERKLPLGGSGEPDDDVRLDVVDEGLVEDEEPEEQQKKRRYSMMIFIVLAIALVVLGIVFFL